MVNLFIALFIFLNPPQGDENKFEGSLQVVKTSLYDTTYLLYKIKGENVKIEEYDKNANLLLTYLVNTSENKVIALDPINKLYKPIPVKPFIPFKKSNFEVIKSENFLLINGYKCNLWRIKNKQDNTEIAYWVTKDDFYFYEEMLKVLNSYEKSLNYFLYIPNNKGYMPMLIVERTLLRDEKLKIEILRIEREFLDNKYFKVPESYKLFN